ncbi:MAG: MFS transporter [Solirubrobacteraceae bacterium]
MARRLHHRPDPHPRAPRRLSAFAPLRGQATRLRPDPGAITAAPDHHKNASAQATRHCAKRSHPSPPPGPHKPARSAASTVPAPADRWIRALERRVAHPLLPLHIVWDRARGGAYVLLALVVSGVFAMLLFLTFYLQQNLGFTPLQAGVAFLPFTGAVVLTAGLVQTKVLPRTGSRPVVIAGSVLGMIAMLLFTRLSPGGSYAGQVLPGLIPAGVGIGSIIATTISTGTLGVKREDAGIASAMVNTSQQVGGSIGTALLSTIFASAAASYAASHPKTAGLANAASVHGYTTAFWWAAAIFALGLLVAALILPSARSTRAITATAEALDAPAPLIEPAV